MALEETWLFFLRQHDDDPVHVTLPGEVNLQPLLVGVDQVGRQPNVEIGCGRGLVENVIGDKGWAEGVVDGGIGAASGREPAAFARKGH